MAAITQSRATEARPATPALASLPQKQKSGDEIWDELLARPESEAFLEMLSAQAHLRIFPTRKRMTSRRNKQFKTMFAKLPKTIQAEARKAYRRWRINPTHPSLAFKHLGHDIW